MNFYIHAAFLLTQILFFGKMFSVNKLGACSSGVEHQIVDLVVVGSKPTRHPYRYVCKTSVRSSAGQSNGLRIRRSHVRTVSDANLYFGPLAQLVEQQTLNLWVVGSNPTWLKRGCLRSLLNFIKDSPFFLQQFICFCFILFI